DLRPLFLGERFLQRAALIHRGCRDDATFVRHRLHSRELTRCDFHVRLSPETVSEPVSQNRHCTTGNSNSSTTAAAVARSTVSPIGSAYSARSTSSSRALVAGCRGVKSVQQS